ncbi:MAG: TonB family protein [Acidobacteriaceae bacterium]|nr:TonB family protein [Acidobacteriaceae bacterium]
MSNAGEKQARKAAVQFEQIRAVFRETIVAARDHPSPMVTILVVKDENSMRDLLPEYWAKGHSHPAGLFISRLNLFFAAVQLETQGGTFIPGRSPYEAFYHEYYHALSLPYVPDLPLWLAEGLAEFFGHTVIEDKFVTTGEIDPLLLGMLHSTPLIPLSTLLQVDRTSAYYNEANKTTVFYAECWGLVHYLMMADRGTHRPMLIAYLNALEQGKSSADAISVAFGDLNKLQSSLQAYIRDSNYQRLRVPPVQFDEAELTYRTLSEGEALAYRGGFAVVRGRHQDGAAILNRALQLDPNVALADEYLAVDEFLGNEHEKALESASKAVALDPKVSFTRYLRALLRTSHGAMGSSDPQIEDDLRQAIALSPEFAPPYGLLAVYLASGNQKLDEALVLANKAISLEPANSNYQLALAQVLIRQNKFDQADLAARRAIAWASDPAEKANADNFKQFLNSYRKLQTEMASAGAGTPQIIRPSDDSARLNSGDPSGPKLEKTSGDVASGTAQNPFRASILRVQSNVTLLSNPLGVDFRAYFKDLMNALRTNLMSSVSKLPISDPKDVTLELSIMKDGTISGMKIASASGIAALDQATQDAINASSPLPALPPTFKSPSLKVRLRFAYTEGQN